MTRLIYEDMLYACFALVIHGYLGAAGKPFFPIASVPRFKGEGKAHSLIQYGSAVGVVVSADDVFCTSQRLYHSEKTIVHGRAGDVFVVLPESH